jgi:hypothetical protein
VSPRRKPPEQTGSDRPRRSATTSAPAINHYERRSSTEEPRALRRRIKGPGGPDPSGPPGEPGKWGRSSLTDQGRVSPPQAQTKHTFNRYRQTSCRRALGSRSLISTCPAPSIITCTPRARAPTRALSAPTVSSTANCADRELVLATKPDHLVERLMERILTLERRTSRLGTLAATLLLAAGSSSPGDLVLARSEDRASGPGGCLIRTTTKRAREERSSAPSGRSRYSYARLSLKPPKNSLFQ